MSAEDGASKTQELITVLEAMAKVADDETADLLETETATVNDYAANGGGFSGLSTPTAKAVAPCASAQVTLQVSDTVLEFTPAAVAAGTVAIALETDFKSMTMGSGSRNDSGLSGLEAVRSGKLDPALAATISPTGTSGKGLTRFDLSTLEPGSYVAVRWPTGGQRIDASLPADSVAELTVT